MNVGFIGGGKMAEAIMRGIIASGAVSADAVRVSDICAERCRLLHEQYGVQIVSGNSDLVAASDVVFLAVKPQGLDTVLGEVAAAVTAEHLVISIAAGKRLAGIAAMLPSARLVRVMPNLPATVGQGISAYCMGAHSTAADRECVGQVLCSFGKAVELPEEQFDAVTAVSGSGPAFFAHFLAQVIDAGERLGLTRSDAGRLATQTMRGTAYLLSEPSIDPTDLIAAVASKKGTTEAGMARLACPALGEAVQAALQAAAERSRELST